MSFWQKCVVVLLAIAIFGGAGYFAHVAFRPVELARLQSIPWVKYVHPNVKRLKQAQDSVREGKLNEAREILVKALVLEPKSPVTRELRDLLGNVDTQIFFSKEPSPRKMECRKKPRRESISSTLAMCFMGSGKSDRRALPKLLSRPMTTSKQWTPAMQIVRVRELP